MAKSTIMGAATRPIPPAPATGALPAGPEVGAERAPLPPAVTGDTAEVELTRQMSRAGADPQIFPVPDPVPPGHVHVSPEGPLDAAVPERPLPVLGMRMPDGGEPVVTATAREMAEEAGRRLSPPLIGPRPMPLAPVAPYGHTTTGAPPTAATVDPAFDRRTAIELLTRHPNAGVRQRALEAQAAIHHAAPDMGIKVKAALDTARAAERNR